MIIDIDTRQTPAVVTLQDPRDFGAFHVATQGGDTSAFDEAVRRLGASGAEGHVFVPRDALERLAGDLAHDPDWRRSLDGMLEYAASTGWLDEEGAIQAHVVHEPSS
jgi:hypothetical protein